MRDCSCWPGAVPVDHDPNLKGLKRQPLVVEAELVQPLGNLGAESPHLLAQPVQARDVLALVL